MYYVDYIKGLMCCVARFATQRHAVVNSNISLSGHHITDWKILYFSWLCLILLQYHYNVVAGEEDSREYVN